MTCIGAGAIGSYVCYKLAQAGVGRLYLIDGDVVEDHNLERTTCYKLKDVGRYKVEALRDCILEVRPWAEVIAVANYLNDLRTFCNEGDEKACEIISRAFGEADLIFVGVDNVWARDLAARYAMIYDKPYVEAAFGPDHGEVY
ncbi:MAG: HesA/MoeB/ThiF family protein, partial [Infirmifilum sp.]